MLCHSSISPEAATLANEILAKLEVARDGLESLRVGHSLDECGICEAFLAVDEATLRLGEWMQRGGKP